MTANDPVPARLFARSARFRKLFHDVYISADVPVTPALLASAILGLSVVGSYASKHTAAKIWGGLVPDQPMTHVSSPRGGTRSTRQGVRSHQTGPRCDVVTFAGMRVSSPAQTFIDLAAELTLVNLVVLGDSLVKKDRTTPGQLVETALGSKAKGCRAALKAARLVRAGVDSPMETRLRLLMVLAGLPEPVVNHIEYNAVGSWKKRFDLSYPALKLIIEYDGRHHASDDRQWKRDIVRRESLDTDGWRLIVIQSHDIYVEPATTLDRICRCHAAVRCARSAPHVQPRVGATLPQQVAPHPRTKPPARIPTRDGKRARLGLGAPQSLLVSVIAISTCWVWIWSASSSQAIASAACAVSRMCRRMSGLCLE